MMLNLEWFPYEKRYWYPHMGPKDIAIWEKFIADFPNAFSRVAYDIKVGEGTIEYTVVNEDTGGDINPLYQRKIDVVGDADGKLVIVEIKPRATTAALGQVNGYRLLFARDFGYTDPIECLVVTDQIMPEMHFLSEAQNVKLMLA